MKPDKEESGFDRGYEAGYFNGVQAERERVEKSILKMLRDLKREKC